MLMSDLWSYEDGKWTLEYGYYNITINKSPGPRASTFLVCQSESNKIILYGGHDDYLSIHLRYFALFFFIFLLFNLIH